MAPPPLSNEELVMSVEPTQRLLFPSVVAGPSVILFLIAAQWSERFTFPILLPPESMLILILVLPIAAIVGVGPALVANAAGTVLMIKLGKWFPLLRFPLIWSLVGGAVAWGAARWLELGPQWVFAYTSSGAVSAFLCRMRLA